MASLAIAELTEKEWQEQVVALARTVGWKVFHTYDSRRSNPGLPDLILVRDRVVFAELKRESGRLSAAQDEWQARLRRAGAEHYVWRPRDLETVGAVLSRRATA